MLKAHLDEVMAQFHKANSTLQPSINRGRWRGGGVREVKCRNKILKVEYLFSFVMPYLSTNLDAKQKSETKLPSFVLLLNMPPFFR